MPVPRKKHDKEKIVKFLFKIAKAANKHARVLPIDAKTKPSFLPIIDIIFAANIVDNAIPTT